MASIAQFIAQRIAELCQCRYSNRFIVGGLLLCTEKNNVVYQAKFLPSDTKTALEIRNITQRWILTKPIIVIDEVFYHVDPYCSIIAKELGSTSCGESRSTEASNQNPSLAIGVSVIELSSIAGVGAMLVFIIVLVILLVLCCVSRRMTKRYDVR